ncbi:integrase catalytic domain-containing protein [Trichonephila clavipes]|nr:integrase catalytic domain-containing protein [Trichonephila clavipes]
MQSLIRERFWIIRARKTIKSILNECFICARFKVKSLSSGPSPLPPDRVNDCAIFEVVGIDLAGPLFLKTGEKELIPLTPAMFLIENRCSDTTDIDELNSRDLRKRMKYRIKLLSDLRQRFRKEYLSELIQKQNDNRVREPRIGEMVLIGNDNKKRLSWPIAKIIELIPGRDGEIRTVRLKTQHGTVIRPVQRIFPLEVQAIANSDKELKEESISVKSTKPEKVLNTNDAIVKKYTSSGRLVKEPKRLDLLNYNCYRFETLPKSQRGEPLTYVSENPEELIPLAPSMFLISNKNSNIEDIEELNSNSLNKRIKYRSKLLKDLRQRFRNEYLSQLIQKHNEKESRDPQIGEVVLVGDDNKKRLFWALAKIIELIPGRDRKIRTFRLKTQHGKMLRPIQPIYPLEIRSNV